MVRGTDGSTLPRDGEFRTGRIVTDGAGSGLFDVTERPVIEYTTGNDGPVIRRLNPAFRDTFGVADELHDDPLTAAPVPVRTTGSDGDETIYDLAREGREGVLTLPCETTTGTAAFEATVVEAGQRGYVIFVETGGDPVPKGDIAVLESVAHSLRNPLEVAEIYTEIASETGELEYLDRVQVAHDRIEAILTDARRLARQGTVIAETEPVDLGPLARDAWQTVDTEAASLAIGSPGTVTADESRLRELFENLFRNAVEHGSTGTQNPAASADSVEHGITDGTDSSTDGVTVTVESIDDGFSVSDDGEGIPPSDRDDVLDVGYTTTEEGTGMGLAIVAEIARGHEWDLAITESESGGAQFEFTGVDRPAS